MLGCPRTRGVKGPTGGGSRGGVGKKNGNSSGLETNVFTANRVAGLPRLSSRRFGGVPAGAGVAETMVRSASATNTVVAAMNRAGDLNGRCVVIPCLLRGRTTGLASANQMVAKHL